MKIITTLIIGLLVALPVQADTTDAVLAELETAGIQFVYATPQKATGTENLTILKTEATTENVDAFVATGRLNDLSGVNVEIVSLAKTLEDATAARNLDERRRQRT